MNPRLTKAEEEVMLVLWKLKEAIVRDVIKELRDSDTPYTTVSTVIRILEKKSFVGHKAVGTTYIYFPLISKREYLKGFLSGVVNNYFNGSESGLLAFFTRETNITFDDLREIMDESGLDLKIEEGGDE